MRLSGSKLVVVLSWLCCQCCNHYKLLTGMHDAQVTPMKKESSWLE